jgi:beta-glucosidase
VIQLTPSAGVVTANWSGILAGTIRFSGRETDLRDDAAHGMALELRYRVELSPQQSVKLGTPGGMLDVTRSFNAATLGEWQTLSVPLACLAARGADLKSISVPLAIETAGPFTLSISDARLTTRNAAAIPECTNGASG